MVALLDVNVLIALFDPSHVHHEAAHAWFAANGERGFASCPLTECAMVRILASPAYPGTRTSLGDATDRLRRLCSSPHHRFWPDSLSWRTAGVFLLKHIGGHRQLTDVYLLALAVKNGGRLATLDGRIPFRAVEGARKEHLALIEA